MSLHIGRKEAKSLYLGNKKITSLHKGADLIYQDSAALYAFKFTVNTALTDYSTINDNWK